MYAPAVPKTKRAPPLPADQRRAAILEAVVPLLVQRGAAVTTKELAAAAGVAEGTLFSVFDGKHDLLVAAIEMDLDPTWLVEAIERGASERDVQATLRAAAGAILPRVEEVHALAAALRAIPEAGVTDRRVQQAAAEAWHAAVHGALCRVLEPHAHAMTQPPQRVAAATLGLLLGSRPHHGTAPPYLDVDDLVDVLVHGVVRGAKAAEVTPTADATA